MIVEDEGLTLMQLRKICLLSGMQVAGIAVDGEQGVQKVLETRPDIVLLDIKMPVLDGFSALERILKELSVCVVMLTAYDLEDHKERARARAPAGTSLSWSPQRPSFLSWKPRTRGSSAGPNRFDLRLI